MFDFRDKVIRVKPKSSNEVDFLSSLKSRQDLKVSFKEGPGGLPYEKGHGCPHENRHKRYRWYIFILSQKRAFNILLRIK